MTEEFIDGLKNKCNENTLVCVGASKENTPDMLELYAVDYGIDAFSKTSSSESAVKGKNSKIYWYSV
jgi:hypothetical protein